LSAQEKNTRQHAQQQQYQQQQDSTVLTFTPHMPTRSTLDRRRKSNIVKATTPAPLSLSDFPPPTKPVVYSPVPTMRTLTLFSDMIMIMMMINDNDDDDDYIAIVVAKEKEDSCCGFWWDACLIDACLFFPIIRSCVKLRHFQSWIPFRSRIQTDEWGLWWGKLHFLE